MMKRLFGAAILAALATTHADAQTWTNIQWGLNKATSRADSAALWRRAIRGAGRGWRREPDAAGRHAEMSRHSRRASALSAP